MQNKKDIKFSAEHFDETRVSKLESKLEDYLSSASISAYLSKKRQN